MDSGDVSRARELLADLVEAAELGELAATAMEVAGLRGGLAALAPLNDVRDTTI